MIVKPHLLPVDPPKSVMSTRGSRMVERALEYQFLGQLTTELLRRGLRYAVLRGDTDLRGYDVVVECMGITRHIQLKGVVAGGATRGFPIHLDLADAPSGCVVMLRHDRETFAIETFGWFGDAPGSPLPDIGDKPVLHSRANAQGIKAIRPALRELPIRRMTAVDDIAALADLLFVPRPHRILLDHLRHRDPDPSGPAWLERMRTGRFQDMPHDLGWEDSLDLAMLVDGYALAETLERGDAMAWEGRQLETAQATGIWHGDAAELWATLFLEHRRWKFSEPFQPDPDMVRLLDRLVDQLRDALLAPLEGALLQ